MWYIPPSHPSSPLPHPFPPPLLLALGYPYLSLATLLHPSPFTPPPTAHSLPTGPSQPFNHPSMPPPSSPTLKTVLSSTYNNLTPSPLPHIPSPHSDPRHYPHHIRHLSPLLPPSTYYTSHVTLPRVGVKEERVSCRVQSCNGFSHLRPNNNRKF